MADRRQPVARQHRIGVLIAIMAAALAVAPLAMALALRNASETAIAWLLVAATLVWMLAFAVYRGMSKAHERWRRKILRREISDIRQARLDAGETFQDTLNEQTAILERIIGIADSLLTDGIIDPMTALENVRAVASHAHEAMGLAEDAIAEVRIETGSTSFEIVSLDIRAEIEQIAAPFIRSGHQITTTGRQLYAETDPSVLRIVVRNLITRAAEHGATEMDLSIARDNDRIVCTVSDYNTDRSALGLAAVSPVGKSLASAVGATLDFGYALGWNRYSVSLPASEHRPGHHSTEAAPLDVVGSRSLSDTPIETLAPRPVEAEPRISFTIAADRADPQPPRAPSKEPQQAR